MSVDVAPRLDAPPAPREVAPVAPPRPVTPEAPRAPESFSRDEVQNTFNGAFGRWRQKVYSDVQYFPEKNFTDMVKTGRIPPEKLKEYGEYFMLQDAVIHLTGGADETFDAPLGTQVKDTITTHFRHPNGTEFDREEGLGIEGLRNYIQSEIDSGKLSEAEIAQRRHEIEVLDGSSTPYPELHPEALSDVNSEEHARVEEEARRVHLNPAFQTGNPDGDWDVAKLRLGGRRELIMPKADGVAVVTLPVPATSEKSKAISRRWAIPLAATATGLTIFGIPHDTFHQQPTSIVEAGSMPSQAGLVVEEKPIPVGAEQQKSQETEQKFMQTTIQSGEGLTHAMVREHGGNLSAWKDEDGEVDPALLYKDVLGSLKQEGAMETLAQFEDKELVNKIQSIIDAEDLIGPNNVPAALRKEINDYNAKNRPTMHKDYLLVKEGQTFTVPDHRTAPQAPQEIAVPKFPTAQN